VYPLSHEHQPPTSADGWPRPEHTGAADLLREAGKSMSLAKKSWSTGRRRCQLGVSDRMCGVGWYAVKAQTVQANICVIHQAIALRGGGMSVGSSAQLDACVLFRQSLVRKWPFAPANKGANEATSLLKNEALKALPTADFSFF
jgi:hypothetical protein